MKYKLADSTLLPEDITYDTRSQSFLITSVSQKKIIRLTPDGAMVDFAISPDNWPMMAIKADPAHGLLWATEAAIDSFSSVARSAWGRSAVLCFDLQTGALRRRIEDSFHCALGDMTLTKNGQPIISDNDSGGIYRVVDNHLQRLDKGGFVSPQTPALHPDGRHLLVPDYVRGIGVLDIVTRRITWLKSAGSKPVETRGVDGLYWDKGYLYLTQNGTSPQRIVRLQLDPELRHIVAQQVIQRSTPSLGDFTHGVFVGHDFYYIVNAGWDRLDEHGDPKKTATFTPARIMRFH
jgi:sugar lactone lactonase YvrE